MVPSRIRRTSSNSFIVLFKKIYEWRGSILFCVLVATINMKSKPSTSGLVGFDEAPHAFVQMQGLRVPANHKDHASTSTGAGAGAGAARGHVNIAAAEETVKKEEVKEIPPVAVPTNNVVKEETIKVVDSTEPNTSAESLKDSAKGESIFQSDHYDVCIIGAGLSGAVIAEQYASQLGKTSLIIEKRDHIGGNVYDFVDPDTNILVNKYGAHLFHTQYYRVWEYLHQFSEWTPYEHKVLGLIGDKHVPIPVNIDTVNLLFDLNITTVGGMNDWLSEEQTKYQNEPVNSEEMAKSRVGERLYNMIFKPYTIKQWAKTPKELGPEVTARIPVRNDWDDRYFPDDVFQALPTHGYTKIFENLIMGNPLIEVHINTDYFDVREELASRSMCGHTYFSGPIDAYFAQEGYDKLEYRSLNFEKKVIKNVGNDKYYLPASVVNYPSEEYDFTRIVEYKHFLKQKSPDTVIYYERSNDDGEPYYPVPNKKNQDLYKKYQKMAVEEPHVTFVGRLANYKYFNMDQSVKNALELFDSNAPRIAIMQMCKEDTGGPEALVQLATAFHAWMPSRTYLVHNDEKYQDSVKLWPGRGYKEFINIPVMEMATLTKGDILIMHDLKKCPKDLIKKGVQVFIWKLGVPRGHSKIEEFLKDGCQFLSHNHYAMSDVDSVDYKLPRSRMLIPYIRPDKTHIGPISNDKRENLILFNHIHPGQRDTTFKEVKEYCKQSSCEVIMLKKFSVDEVKKLYQRAKIIVSECLMGSERSVIEAVLSGALFVTNDCFNGKDLRDFPIPRQHKFSNKIPKAEILTRLLENFEEEQKKLDGFRQLYTHYSHETLVEDTKRFVHAVV